MLNGHTYNANFSYANSIDTYAGTGLFNSRRRVPDELSKRMRLLGERASIQFLITVTAGYWLRGAVQHSGRVYKFTNTPTDEYPVAVSGVHMNGAETSLTAKTALADCVSTAGTYHFDSANRTIYVHPPTPTTRTIFDDTYQAKLVFYFSQAAKNLRGVNWQGRLVSAPSLSLRIDSRFTGVGQIGGGTLTLANRDSFFDEIDEIQWNAGSVSMEIGVDYPDGSAPMSEADYQKVGTWRIDKVSRSSGNFVLTLREPKHALENKIPRRTFTRAEFPNIEDDKIGKPIPWAWGRLFGVKPMPIDKAARRFKLADHEIRSIEAVRVRNSDGSEGWRTVAVASQDLRAAEFTLSAVDWANNEELSVDFLGRRNSDGSLMENPADIMEDLLDYCGIGAPALDSESFNLSRAFYRVGTNRFGEEVVKLAPCIYLDSQRTGIEVASEINSIAGSFLFVGHDGLWRYGAFRPVRASDLDPMAGTVIQQFSEAEIIRDSLSKEVDSSRLASKIVVEFAPRRAEDWTERVEVRSELDEDLHGLSPEFGETKKVGLGTSNHARYWSQRYLTTEAQPMTKYQFVIPWLGFFLMPGDKLQVEHDRFNLNHVLEVLECHYNFNSPPSVRFVLGNNRGWGRGHGFWKEKKTATPPTLDMTLWLRPENHLHTEGQKIDIWRDASGNDFHGTGYGVQSGGSGTDGPILKHQSLSANGLPVAYLGHYSLAGANESHHFAFPPNLNPLLSLRSQGEVFAVLKPDDITPGSGNNAIWEFSDAGPSLFPHSAGDIREGFGCSAIVTGISAANIVTGWNLYNCSRQAGNLTVKVNNVSVYNADPGGAVAFALTPQVGTSFPNQYLDGAFAEVIVYNRVLTTAERADVIQYLSDKYALSIVAIGSAEAWNPAWTDEQADDALNNNGYWTEKSGSVESEMADITDRRSHRPSRWW